MRISSLLLYGFAAATFALRQQAPDQRWKRDGSTIASNTISASVETSQPPQASPSPSIIPSTNASSILQTASSTISIPTTSAVSQATNSTSIVSNTTSSERSDDQLPLQPVVTPAIGVAGVILLITGLIYGIVGIKIRSIYTFFSTAYLTGLAVTVLILYVVNPPISDGIQGAYLVAVLAAGCVFGGLSLIFHEITKGFGCALGGFSLAMWFLTLAPDGLVHTKTAKVVFIVIFMVVVSALSVPKQTRDIALIGSLPFAGATVAILGIDCFSNAGLKEFWVYLWDLNDNIFPLGTTGYPITRGMRVESAGVILLFLLGLVAQLKLFKLIEKRRAERKHERRQLEAANDREEIEIARKLNVHVERDMARWEAAYGSKGGAMAAATSVDSFKNSASSHKERSFTEKGTVSMKELPDMPDRTLVTVRSVSDDDTIEQLGIPKIRLDEADEAAYEMEDIEGQQTLSAPSPEIVVEPLTSEELASRSPQSDVPPPPVVTPLPFRIPTMHRESRKSERRRSIGSGRQSLRDRNSKRMSATTDRVKSFASSTPTSASQEDLMLSTVDDRDDTASVGATIDDLDDDGSIHSESIEAININRRSAITEVDIRKSMLIPDYHGIPEDLKESTPSGEEGEIKVSSNDSGVGEVTEEQLASNRSSLAKAPSSLDLHEDGRQVEADSTESKEHGDAAESTSGTDIEPEGTTKHNIKEETSDLDVDLPKSDLRARRARQASMKSARSSKSGISQAPTPAALKELPAALSKIVLSYRTNEWAKHLSVADEPTLSNLEASSPGVMVDTAFQQESAQSKARDSSPRPGYVGSEPPIPLLLSQSSPTLPPTDRASSRLSMTFPKQQRFPVNPQAASGNSGSRPGSRRNSGIASRPGSAAGHHSAPLRAVTSPTFPEAIEEQPDEPARMGSLRTIGSIQPVPSTTLLDQRNNLMNERLASMSFQSAVPTISRTPSYQHPPRPGTAMSISSNNGFVGAGVLDDLPLQQRKVFLSGTQRWSGTSHISTQPQHLPRSTPTPTQAQWGPAASTIALDQFNSHQPDRSPYGSVAAARQGNLYNNWRETLQRSTTGPPVADEGRRAAMINEKRWDQMRFQQHQQNIQVRDDTFDHMMRRGDMLDLHREALRKMQAGVRAEDQ